MITGLHHLKNLRSRRRFNVGIFGTLVICVVMGLIGALVGKNKGRKVEGFFWGFFLGLIGILIVALRKPVDGFIKG